MRDVKYTTRFQRDYRREKSGRYSKRLDALLMEVVNLLAADTPLPRRNFDHPLSGEWNDHRDGFGLPEQNRDKRGGVQDHFGRPCSS